MNIKTNKHNYRTLNPVTLQVINRSIIWQGWDTCPCSDQYGNHCNCAIVSSLFKNKFYCTKIWLMIQNLNNKYMYQENPYYLESINHSDCSMQHTSSQILWYVNLNLDIIITTPTKFLKIQPTLHHLEFIRHPNQKWHQIHIALGIPLCLL